MVKKRRIVQIGFIFFLLVVGFLNYYENQKLKQNFDRFLIKDSFFLGAMDKVFGALENRHEIMTFVQGDLWALRVGKMRIVDPLALIGNITRTRSFYLPMIIFAMIPIIFTIIFGRFYCGWLCPMGLLGEVNAKIREFIINSNISLFDVNLSTKAKYYVLGFGLFTGMVFGVHYFFVIYPPKLISYEIYSLITYGYVSYGFFTILTISIIEILFGSRLWCRSICPGGALYSLISKIRVVGVSNEKEACNACGICDKKCPHDAVPSGAAATSECDQCGICIDICPKKSLSYSKRNFADIFNRKTLLFFIITILYFNASTVEAHHVRGLPHYAYAENYQETATIEE
ncbi:MAG: 4Fe-4S binding protein, partial [Nitrospirae bacterium]|nr:4Fe-4S binding protein [Nitrospirota bacterium]